MHQQRRTTEAGCSGLQPDRSRPEWGTVPETCHAGNKGDDSNSNEAPAQCFPAPIPDAGLSTAAFARHGAHRTGQTNAIHPSVIAIEIPPSLGSM